MSRRASNALDKNDYSFIAVTKTNGEVSIWLGLKGSLVKDSTFDLGGATYGISDTEAIFLVQPGASKAQIPHGWVGKMNFNTAQKWGDVAHPAKDYPLWDNYIENNMWTVSSPLSLSNSRVLASPEHYSSLYMQQYALVDRFSHHRLVVVTKQNLSH